MKERILKVGGNGGIFLLLCLLTYYMIIRETQPSQILSAISGADYRYLLPAVCAMGVFLFCEGLNLGRCLRLFQPEVPVCSGVKYAVTGFFGSSVTPSASGGQPIQLYFMHKDRVKLSHGTLALLVELLSYQIVTITLAVVGFFAVQETLSAAMGNLRFLLFIGIGINAVAMAALLCAIFYRKLAEHMAGFLVNIVKRCSGKKGEKLETMLFDALQEYQQCAASLKENKTVLIKTIMITTIQMLAMHSVPYWVYLSLGLSDCSAVTMILLQAVLFASVSALPLPGAMGVSEGAFSILFGTLFTSGLLPGAMVLSRSISFYLPLAVSGLYTLMLVLIRQKGAF